MENHGSFSVLWTGDGSPSLRGAGESMHHLGGAYSETQYIYGEALRKLLAWPDLKEWKVLVVGLGLGYIELLAAAEALKNHKQLSLLSYEIQPELVEAFLAWLQSESSNNKSNNEDNNKESHKEHLVYDRIYEFFQRDYPSLEIKKSLLAAYQEGRWKINGALNNLSLPSESYHALLFDAFSGKSTPDLWTEEFLKLFLEQMAADQSIFSTYACTGILKRTLATQQFQVEKRKGFLGKRHSTLAIKNQL